eukprot:UN07853
MSYDRFMIDTKFRIRLFKQKSPRIVRTFLNPFFYPCASNIDLVILYSSRNIEEPSKFSHHPSLLQFRRRSSLVPFQNHQWSTYLKLASISCTLSNHPP